MRRVVIGMGMGEKVEQEHGRWRRANGNGHGQLFGLTFRVFRMHKQNAEAEVEEQAESQPKVVLRGGLWGGE